MGKFEEQLQKRLSITLNKVNDTIKLKAADIIAEKATAYFRERFSTKEWNGQAWQEAQRPPRKGSLMLRSAALMGSIRPSLISAEKVVISAGNQKVQYARIHNEGGQIAMPERTQINTFKTFKAGKNKGKTLFAKNNVQATFSQKNIIKAHTVNMPKRQFMGTPQELLKIIRDTLIAEFKQ